MEILLTFYLSGINKSMPTYTLYDSKQDMTYQTIMPYNEMKALIKNNPHISHIMQPPNFADPTRLDATRGKPDEAFRDRLKEIKTAHSGGLTKSTVNTW